MKIQKHIGKRQQFYCITLTTFCDPLLVMSTKRAVVLAKDCRFGNKLIDSRDNTHQYSSINLNQSYKCEAVKVLQFDSKSDKTQKSSVTLTNQNHQERNKEISDLRKRNDLPNPYANYLKEDKKQDQKWQSKYVENLNKSTLSLHIAAYESGIEAQNIDDEKVVGTNQVSFAFPRQQKIEESMVPGMMQFKTSQNLLNLNATNNEKYMSGRITRLWQPGNPQNRVFFPDFWLRLVETPSVGYNRLPKNAAKFEVNPRMSRYDVQEYLEKIYKLPVREVRIRNEMGEISWNAPLDHEKRVATWKEEDRKFAFVFFPKNFEFYFPVIFTKDEFEDEVKKLQKFTAEDLTNEKYVNRDRAGIGESFGI